jgi:hypothetical protein
MKLFRVMGTAVFVRIYIILGKWDFFTKQIRHLNS